MGILGADEAARVARRRCGLRKRRLEAIRAAEAKLRGAGWAVAGDASRKMSERFTCSCKGPRAVRSSAPALCGARVRLELGAKWPQ